jgi:aryl-alcohol dehydrogenase-like predicted oxidoreductase
MRQVKLGDTGLYASRLGFGCAPMGGRVSARTSRRALAAAFAQGVTFFDTARSYGYGESERILGEFLKGKRQHVVVATKCGIDAGRASLPKRALKALLRPVLDHVPAARSTLRGAMGRQHSPGQFTLADVGRSIEASLSELGTDYIDLLFLHMPPAAVLDRDDLFGLLDGLMASGKLRAYGVSASHDVISSYLTAPRAAQSGRAVQYQHSWREPYPERALLARPDVAAVGNQPFGGTNVAHDLQEALRSYARTLGPGDTLRAKLLRSESDVDVTADAAISCALRGTLTQVIVCSMFRDEHIVANVQAVEASRFTDEEVQCLRTALQPPEVAEVSPSFSEVTDC